MSVRLHFLWTTTWSVGDRWHCYGLTSSRIEQIQRRILHRSKICTANICANICGNIGATLKIPQILAQIFAAKKRKYTHRKYLRKYLRKYWCNAKNTANIGANICGKKSENIRTANICANICANIYGKKAKNTYGSLLFSSRDLGYNILWKFWESLA